MNIIFIEKRFFMSFICFPDLSSVQDLPFYTVSVGLHYWQYPTERPDGYAYPQFLYSSQGQGILTTEGYTIEIPPRSIIYLPPNSPHSYHAITDIWDVRWFVPSGFEALKLLQQLGFQKAAVFPITDLRSLEELHNKIHMAFQRNTKDSLFFSASYTYEFIFEFYRQYKQIHAIPALPYRKRLTPLLDYMEQHFSEPLTQQDLCAYIQVTPQHLCRMFKQCLQTRPMEYLAQIRIRHACELLRNTKNSIDFISYAVGFHNTNYFCKVFKKIQAITPGQYRISPRPLSPTDPELNS